MDTINEPNAWTIDPTKSSDAEEESVANCNIRSHSNIDPSRMPSLLEENERLRMLKRCKICLVVDIQTLFLPCRHLVCCQKCGDAVSYCPVCRREILGTVKTYHA